MSIRLLIADDDRDAADTLAILLQEKGFEVTVAYNGEQAIETALAVNPDFLILDLAMPNLDGYQVADRLRAVPSFAGKRFVALTGYSDQRHLDEASRVRFDEYFVKPCKLDLLLKVLTEAPIVV
jgi:CheY-like chemotaxis protein